MRSSRKPHRAVMRKPGTWLVLLAIFIFGTVAQAKDTNWSKVASSMTGAQKVASAQKLVNNCKRIHKSVANKLAQARKSQDLVAVDCLGAKLTRIGALLFMAEKDNVGLSEAVSKGDTAKANHLYTKIAQAEGKVRDLQVEASQCWGKEGIYTGKTDISVQQPPNITNDDPTTTPWKEPVDYRPSSASTFY